MNKYCVYIICYYFADAQNNASSPITGTDEGMTIYAPPSGANTSPRSVVLKTGVNS